MSDPPPVFSYRMCGGLKVPRMSSEQANSYCDPLDVHPKDDEIVICAYPSSGDEIVRKIVLSLLSNRTGMSEETNGSLNDGLHVYTTHLPFCRSRWNPRTKYIVVLRNPKQVCVSFFYHFNKLFRKLYGKQPEENCSFNTFYRLFVTGRVAYGDYFIHVRSWIDRKCGPYCICENASSHDLTDSENLLLITYEDLETDFDLNVAKIARFLGVFDGKTPQQEELVVQRTDRALLKSDSVDSTDENSNGRRKMGLAAGWESHFSKEHRSIFDEWIRWNGNASIYNRFWFDAL